MTSGALSIAVLWSVGLALILSAGEDAAAVGITPEIALFALLALCLAGHLMFALLSLGRLCPVLKPLRARALILPVLPVIPLISARLMEAGSAGPTWKALLALVLAALCGIGIAIVRR